MIKARLLLVPITLGAATALATQMTCACGLADLALVNEKLNCVIMRMAHKPRSLDPDPNQMIDKVMLFPGDPATGNLNTTRRRILNNGMLALQIVCLHRKQESTSPGHAPILEDDCVYDDLQPAPEHICYDRQACTVYFSERWDDRMMSTKRLPSSPVTLADMVGIAIIACTEYHKALKDQRKHGGDCGWAPVASINIVAYRMKCVMRPELDRLKDILELP
jgi:hypothetical protein